MPRKDARNIKKQNEAWEKKENKEKANFPKKHPWHVTDMVIAMKLENMWNRLEISEKKIKRLK